MNQFSTIVTVVVVTISSAGCASLEETVREWSYRQSRQPLPELNIESTELEVSWWALIRCRNRATTYRQYQHCKTSSEVKKEADAKYAQLEALRAAKMKKEKAAQRAELEKQRRAEAARKADIATLTKVFRRADLSAYLNRVGRHWLVADGYRLASVLDARLVDVSGDDDLQIHLSSRTARSLVDMRMLAAYACIAANTVSKHTFVRVVYFNLSGPGADCDHYFAVAVANGYFAKPLKKMGENNE